MPMWTTRRQHAADAALRHVEKAGSVSLIVVPTRLRGKSQQGDVQAANAMMRVCRSARGRRRAPRRSRARPHSPSSPPPRASRAPARSARATRRARPPCHRLHGCTRVCNPGTTYELCTERAHAHALSARRRRACLMARPVALPSAHDRPGLHAHTQEGEATRERIAPRCAPLPCTPVPAGA
jgi:hypothetical protein